MVNAPPALPPPPRQLDGQELQPAQRPRLGQQMLRAAVSGESPGGGLHAVVGAGAPVALQLRAGRFEWGWGFENLNEDLEIAVSGIVDESGWSDGQPLVVSLMSATVGSERRLS